MESTGDSPGWSTHTNVDVVCNYVLWSDRIEMSVKLPSNSDN